MQQSKPDDAKKKYSLPLKLFLFIGIFWTIFIVFLLSWAIRSGDNMIHTRTLTQARAFLKQIILTRYWSAIHGGVYVPVTKETQPNPYLEVPHRDVHTEDGQLLTLVNPAYMTRQIAEIADSKGSIHFHITSLNPIRPGNNPEDWEAFALRKFLSNESDEYYEWWQPDEKEEKTFRYMAPLWTEKACLTCHSKQGYAEGDLRGGISVTIPANGILSEKMLNHRLLAGSFFLIWAAGLSGIFFSFRLSKSEYMKRSHLIEELETALKDVKTLGGFIPICASCKKIRNDQGYWDRIEQYIGDHSDAKLSHGICPDCMQKLYPEFCGEVTGKEKPDKSKPHGRPWWDEDRLQAFIESERRFRELTELLPETIFEADLQGVLTFANQKAFDVFGFTRDDFDAGILAFDVISEKDRDRAKKNLEKILQGEAVQDNELEMKKKDDSVFPGLVRISAIARDNGPAGFRGLVMDITEKKRTQEFLIQNEKMMSIGGLASGIAHEMNNPLSGILQNAQLIFNRLIGSIPGNEKAACDSGTDMESIKAYIEKRKIGELLENIRISAIRATETVRSMLDFARQKPFVPKPVDLSVVVDDTFLLLRQNRDFKYIRMIKQFDPDLPYVLCEGNRICQVIMNIINNSMDAALEQWGTVKDLVLYVRLTHEKGKVRMEIEDNGPGMDEEVQRHIFEPFFTTKEPGKGTGLGLSIAYFLIVDLHKGKIEVQSTPGQGTTFIVTLPVEPSH
ncbi:MAG: hypothetical protein A2277_12630 [Desulfobacterales bacterium RIFOXYA12_FULL_46_15]|nr:MAG: hypothetical protein A2277_12630 [Desulfobacterales bacterium RIFOXYA12_FULL_46_15]